jgi:hypothetical protein
MTDQTVGPAAQTVVSGVTRMPMSDLISGNGIVAAAGYDQDYRLTSCRSLW